MNIPVPLYPPSASSMAAPVDRLFLFLTLFSTLLTLLIAGLIIFFALKYRRKHPQQTGADLPTYNSLEIGWTLIPLAIAMVMFSWGAALYVRLSKPPAEAMTINVTGKQWMWKIEHPQGRKEINELHVPLNRPIRLVMTSQDVIHSFFIPAFRIKQDVLPGRFVSEWFTPTALGEYHLFCTQYCGTSHSRMIGRVIVMPPADYDAWAAGVGADQSPVALGAQLFERYGCASCHGQQAPSLAGLYGRKRHLTDGRTVIADEDYIRESIINPRGKIAAGYAPIMPSFENQLTAEQLFQLIAYIKSLQPVEKPEDEQPKAPATTARAPAPGGPS